ncbi:hypothetical protein ILUMI_13846 [Ignelater luminosus]|uniref:Uncharacterized protein n=1 Tax=Ignelater luminosus TaxID=2038154 RepID=A0A8K0CRI7_IGNLU|nr:hypothetical protein ILUMI_13846 [Ignelater luminosus]
MCYGLTLKDTAALYAVANNKLIPELWKENQCAAIIWIYLFRQGHNNISLRPPEAKNLDRATNFNKTHVTFFFKNLKEVIEKHNLTALQIYNYDETGVTNVHKPPKILAPKHQKRVGKVINAKRDVHKMQPLDLSCFGPFKGYYNKAADEWMLNHPGTLMSIYGIASVTGQAFPSAFTPTNITKGFEKFGIFSYNSEVFQDYDFLSSYVSDRIEVPNIETDTSVQNKGTKVIFDINAPSTSKSGCSKKIVSPEVVRPHLRVSPRKISKTSKRKIKSTVLTDTPNKEELELAHEKRITKKD